MARPKDKAIKDQTRSLQDRGKRAKNKIKISLATQLRNDVGRLFTAETYTDLVIRVQGRDINVHKFIIKTRSIDIYRKLLELAGITNEDNVSIVHMPDWMEYNTIKELLRQLYTAIPLDTFVDEVDGKYETLLIQNLLEKLSPRKQTSQHTETDESVNKSTNFTAGKYNEEAGKVQEEVNTCKQVETLQNTDGCNHDNKSNSGQDDRVNNVHVNVFSQVDTDAAQNEHVNTCRLDDSSDQSYHKTDIKGSSCIVQHAKHHQSRDISARDDTACEVSDSTNRFETATNVSPLPGNVDDTCITHDVESDISNIDKEDLLAAVSDKHRTDTDLRSDMKDVDLTGLEESKPSLCDMIKLSYNISVPYETCSQLGEDLLRGYLQEIDHDCILVVSGTHFKAHKCILCVRSSYFTAMLSGSWMESSADEMILDGITPGVIEQILLFLYGGVIELNETCLLGEFVMAADMYGIEGLKDVINFTLTKQLCHFFHKPCSVCETGVVDALSTALTYNLPELKDKCIRWINNYMTKVWRNKTFASLPLEMIDSCSDALISELSVNNVLEVMLDCQQLSRVIPHVRWSEPTLCAVTKVMDKAIEFTSQNFVTLLTSSKFVHANRGLAYQMGLLEEIFEAAIRSIPIASACEIYLNLYTRQPREGVEEDDYLEEYKDFMKSLFNKCEKFIELHIHHVTQTKGWDLLSKDIQTQLLKSANFVCIDNLSQTRRAKPKLTSMQKRTPSEVIKDLKDDKRFMSTKSGTTTGKDRCLKKTKSLSMKPTSSEIQSNLAAESVNQSKGASSKSIPRTTNYPSKGQSSRLPSKSQISSVPRKDSEKSTGRNNKVLLKKTAVKSLRTGYSSITGNLSGASTNSVDSSGRSDGWSSVSSLDIVTNMMTSCVDQESGGLQLNASNVQKKQIMGSGSDFEISDLKLQDNESTSSVQNEHSAGCEYDTELQLMNFIADVQLAEPVQFTWELIPVLEFLFSQPGT